MKKRTSRVSRRIVSLLMSMVLTLTLVTPAAFATEVVDGSGTTIVEGNTNPADANPGADDGTITDTEDTNSGDSYDVQEDTLPGISLYAADTWSGTADTTWYDASKNEFEISTAAQLAGLAQLVNSGTENFLDKIIKLTADIDLGGKTWTPIGNSSKASFAFKGIFYGQGHTISNLYVPDTYCPGLFGNVNNVNSLIQDLVVTGTVMASEIAGDDGDYSVGGVCCETNGTIQNCGFYGKIAADEYFIDEVDGNRGGVVGDGKAVNCWFYSTDADSDAGVTGNRIATNCYQNVSDSVKGTYKTNEEFANGTVVGLLNANLPEGCKKWVQGSECPLFTLPVAAWDGTVDTEWYDASKNEFEIGTAAQLAGLAQLVNSGTETFPDKTIKLTADIDLGGKTWTPIGNSSKASFAFKGIFYGQGHTISNLYVPDTYCPGLFGNVNNVNSLIQDLVVTGTVMASEIAGDDGDYSVGGVCCETNGTIQNCGFYGKIAADEYFIDEVDGNRGGVVGDGKAVNCWFYSTDADSDAGVTGNRIATNCYQNVSDSVKGTYRTNEEFANGTVVGLLNANLPEGCKKWVQGTEYPVFPNADEAGKTVTLVPFFSDSACAGLVTVSGTADESGRYSVTEDTVKLDSSYEGDIYITTDQTGKDAKLFDTDGYALTEDTTFYYGTKDEFDAAKWYENGSYELGTALELKCFANLVNRKVDSFAGKTIVLTADVDLNNAAWVPIGSFVSRENQIPFEGSFNGKGHIISGLSATGDGDQALFGYVGNSTVVENLIVIGTVAASGTGRAAGIVARNVGDAWNAGNGQKAIVQNCGFYGTVTAQGASSGINGGGSVSNCWYYYTGSDENYTTTLSGAQLNCRDSYTNAVSTQYGVTTITTEQFRGQATVKDGKTLVGMLNLNCGQSGSEWAQGTDYPVFAADSERQGKKLMIAPLFPDCEFTVSVEGEGVSYSAERGVYTIKNDAGLVKLTRSDGKKDLWVSADASGTNGVKVSDEDYTLTAQRTILYYGTEADLSADITWWYNNQTQARYSINSAAALRGIARLVNSGKVTDGFKGYLLELRGVPNATLDLSDIDYEPIGTADHPFRGSFAGQYYGGTIIGTVTTIITGLTISGDYANTGLFGVVDGGTIQNVTIADTTKTKEIEKENGTKETVEVTVPAGTVTGSGNVGSIVGWLQSGTVENCMSAAVVNGSSAAVVGGLVGLNEGTVSSSYYYNDEHIGTLVVGKTDGENASAKQNFYLVGKGESTFGEDSDTGAREKLEFEAGRVTYELNGPNGYLWRLDTVAKRPTLKDAYPRTMDISQLTLTEEKLPEGVTAEIKLGDENTIVLTKGSIRYMYGAPFSYVPVTVESVTEGYQVVFNPKPQNGKLRIGSDYTYKLTAADISWYIGHENDMEYTLTTASQLEGFAILVNGTAEGDVSFKGKTIKLGNDIELTGTWTPIGIGTNGHFFEGTFDGQKHTIKGLRVNTNDTYAGLFGYVRYGAIKDLTVEGSVRSSGANTAGIVGYLYQGTVENCTNKAEVTAVMGNVGGVVGHAYEGNGECRIENCKNKVAVTATGNEVNGTDVGGIVGSTGDKVIVRLCENTGNVTASGTKNVSASGIGGRRVLNSHNSGRVEIASGTADYLYAGGITAQGLVDSCQNDGEVYINAMWNGDPGFNYAGGITGGGTVTNSYNTAAVVNNFTYADGAAKSQNGIVAGIAANPTSSIINCYNTGDVSGAEGVAYGLGGVGVPGVCDSGVENSYYVCKVSGKELMKYISTAGVESVVAYNEADKTYMVGDKLLVDLLNENCSGGTPWFVNAEKDVVLPTFVVLWNGNQHAACTGIKLVYVIYEPGDGICRTATGQPRKDAIVLEPGENGMIQPVSYTVLDAEMAGVANENGTFQMWSDGSSTYAAGGTITLSGDESSITLTAQWETIWSGTGTEADPYQIPDSEKLAALATQVNANAFDYKGKWFKLTDNIAIAGEWAPIGVTGNPFAGSLNGDGKSITNLNIRTDKAYAGLFGYAVGGTFVNLKLSATISSTGANVGSLVGDGTGLSFCNIDVTADINGGYSYTGGIVGYCNSVTMESCSVAGRIAGVGVVGGFAAGVRTGDWYGTFTNCHNHATVVSTGTNSGVSAAGIVAGTGTSGGTFIGCSNLGNVTATSGEAAGIAIRAYKAANCINNGSITSDGGIGSYAAGIAVYGWNAEQCVNTGSVTGKTAAAGILVGSDGTVENCYNTGTITAVGKGFEYQGAYGITASFRGKVKSCFTYNSNNHVGICPIDVDSSQNKVVNSYYLASSKDELLSAGEYATLADFASGKVAWGVDGGEGAHANYWTQDTARGQNQMPAGPGRAYPKPIEDPNTEFSVYRALVQYGTGGMASLEANGHSSENQENAVYGMKGTSVTVTATPKDDTFGLKSLTLDLMGTGSTTALESGDNFTLGEANALVVAAFASTGNGGSGDGTGGNGGDGDGTGTDTGDGAGDEDDEGLQDGLNLEVEYDVKGLVLAAYGAWGAEGSGKTFTQWLKDSPEVLRALITNSLDNMAVAAMGKKTDEAKDLAALLLASLNEHSGLDGQSSDTIGKMLRKYIESGTEAAFSAWLTTGGGMASGTYESIFAQYTNSLLALADRLYTSWESSGTALTFPQWLDAQQVTMESLSENAEEPDSEPDDTQTTEAPEDVPDGQAAEGGASSGGNSVWEVIGTVVRENPIIVWSIVAVVAALIIVGAVHRYHKVKRDERDDVTSKK